MGNWWAERVAWTKILEVLGAVENEKNAPQNDPPKNWMPLNMVLSSPEKTSHPMMESENIPAETGSVVRCDLNWLVRPRCRPPNLHRVRETFRRDQRRTALIFLWPTTWQRPKTVCNVGIFENAHTHNALSVFRYACRSNVLVLFMIWVCIFVSVSSSSKYPSPGVLLSRIIVI